MVWELVCGLLFCLVGLHAEFRPRMWWRLTRWRVGRSAEEYPYTPHVQRMIRWASVMWFVAGAALFVAMPFSTHNQ
jgi:uncharacterized membrane protein YbhN (UPF0104 family)